MDNKKRISLGKKPAYSSALGDPPNKIVKKDLCDGQLLLHDAILQNNEQLFRELLKSEYKTQIDAQDSSGDTALHLAANNKFDNFIHLLLKKKATSDLQNKNGETFLDTIRNVAARHEREKEIYMNNIRSNFVSNDSGKLNK